MSYSKKETNFNSIRTAMVKGASYTPSHTRSHNNRRLTRGRIYAHVSPTVALNKDGQDLHPRKQNQAILDTWKMKGNTEFASYHTGRRIQSRIQSQRW